MRPLRVAVLVLVGLLVAAPPAAAHGGTASPATSYRSEVTAVAPALDVVARIVDAGTRIELDANGHDVLVLGYEGEPYLRIERDGVFENVRSPSTYLNASLDAPPPPPEASADAEPEWRRVGDGPTARWHSHALHLAPSQVELGGHVPWSVAIEVDGTPATITGRTVILDPPSRVPWFVLAALLAVAGFLAARRSSIAMVLALIVAVDVARVAGLVLGTPTWIEARSAVAIDVGTLPFVGWCMAAAGIWFAARGRRFEAGAAAIVGGGVIAVAGGLLELADLAEADLGSALADGAARTAVAAALGLGVACVAAGAFQLWRRSSPHSHQLWSRRTAR